MVGTYDLITLLLGVVLSLGTVVVCLWRKCFFKYFFVNLYVLFSLAFTLALLYMLQTDGLGSPEYFFFYYTADAIQNIIGYLLIASFFDRMLRGSIFQRYVRPTVALFFFGVVGVSALFISRNVEDLYSRFVIEFQQNMFFVGVLLTFLLWISMSYLHVDSRRFSLLVSGLGIYFSSHAASYALEYLAPSLGLVLAKVPPLAYNFMVGLWMYTFWRIAEGVPAAEPARAGPREAAVKVQV